MSPISMFLRKRGTYIGARATYVNEWDLNMFSLQKELVEYAVGTPSLC